MKHIQFPLPIILVVVLFFSSCKEQTPIGLSSLPQGSDSTYTVTPIPSPQTKNVLMEEFTGTTCKNCPTKGSVVIKTLKSQYNEKLVVAKMYSNFLCDKVSTSDPELRNDQAEELWVYLGANNKPSSSIDRQYDNANNSVVYQPAIWTNLVAQQAAKSSSMNINIISDYSPLDKKVDLEINFVLNQPYTGLLNYSIYVVEDSIIAGQETDDPNIPSQKILDYVHNEVMQQCVSPVGVGFSFPEKFKLDKPGNALRKKLSFTLNNKVLNPTNCKIIVFVHRNEASNKEVLQVVETDL